MLDYEDAKYVSELERALEAIKARINGEWDNLALTYFGLLRADTEADILRIIEEVTE